MSAVSDRESLSEETKEAKEKLCKVFLEFVIATFASVSKDHVDEEESLLVMHALSVCHFSLNSPSDVPPLQGEPHGCPPQ